MGNRATAAARRPLGWPMAAPRGGACSCSRCRARGAAAAPATAVAAPADPPPAPRLRTGGPPPRSPPLSTSPLRLLPDGGRGGEGGLVLHRAVCTRRPCTIEGRVWTAYFCLSLTGRAPRLPRPLATALSPVSPPPQNRFPPGRGTAAIQTWHPPAAAATAAPSPSPAPARRHRRPTSRRPAGSGNRGDGRAVDIGGGVQPGGVGHSAEAAATRRRLRGQAAAGRWRRRHGRPQTVAAATGRRRPAAGGGGRGSLASGRRVSGSGGRGGGGQPAAHAWNCRRGGGRGRRRACGGAHIRGGRQRGRARWCLWRWRGAAGTEGPRSARLLLARRVSSGSAWAAAAGEWAGDTAGDASGRCGFGRGRNRQAGKSGRSRGGRCGSRGSEVGRARSMGIEQSVSEGGGEAGVRGFTREARCLRAWGSSDASVQSQRSDQVPRESSTQSQRSDQNICPMNAVGSANASVMPVLLFHIHSRAGLPTPPRLPPPPAHLPAHPLARHSPAASLAVLDDV